MEVTEVGDSGTDLAIVLGTRPEIIKLSPIIRECERQGISYSIIHTGQHYSDNLNSVFFEQLELPVPDHNLGIGSASHAEQTAEMMAGIEEILLKESPEVVLVQGDTNSVLAGAITVSKLDIELGHVEAGLRSFDRDMPEETNRVLTDHTADYLFAPTEQSREYLLEEGVSDDRIYVTGNTVVDAVQENRKIATRKSSVLRDIGATRGEFVLVTAHRAENVDDPDRFQSLLRGIDEVGRQFDLDIIYPIHPRASARLEEFDIVIPESIRFLDPLDYLDFLKLEDAARLILTDSGGVQEEACILGTPCVTMRDSTERPETIEAGANCLAGTDHEMIVQQSRSMMESSHDWRNPFGDGTAAEQIFEALMCETIPIVQS